MATTVSANSAAPTMEDKLQELTVEWNSDRFMAMLAAFLNNLTKLYPECALVARQAVDVTALQGAPPDLVTAYIKEWHRAMSQEHAGQTLYQMVKRRDAAFFRCGLCPLVGDLDLAGKWDAVTPDGAPDLDEPSRGYIWTYLERLNRHARFACLAPQKMLTGISRMVEEGVDMSNEAGLLAAVERLGPHMADHVELANATQLIPDLLETFMGDAGADMLNVMNAMMGGNGGSLEDIVGAMAAQMAVTPSNNEGGNVMTALMEQLHKTDPTNTEDTPSFQAMLENYKEANGRGDNPMAALIANWSGNGPAGNGTGYSQDLMRDIMTQLGVAGNGGAGEAEAQGHPMAALMAQLGGNSGAVEIQGAQGNPLAAMMAQLQNAAGGGEMPRQPNVN